MSNDSRSLLAVTISILAFVLWYSVISPKIWPPEEKPQTNVEKKEEVTEKSPSVKENKEETKSIAEDKSSEKINQVISTLQNNKFVAKFTNYGARPISWQLNEYTIQDEEGNDPVSMVPAEGLPENPLEITFEKANFNFPEDAKYQLVESDDSRLVYQWSQGGFSLQKIYTLGDHGYDINLEIILINNGDATINEQIALGWSALSPKEKQGGFLSFLKRPSNVKVPVYLLNGDVEREKSPSNIKEEIKAGVPYWAGIEDRYFFSAIAPRIPEETAGVKLASFNIDNERGFYSGIVLPETNIAPGGSEKYSFVLYAGPKDMDILKSVGMRLDKAMDFGWFTFIAIPILYILKFFYSLIHNYGISIILLTIFIKIILYPISKRSMKSMKGMKDLQPRLKELKEKYKDNKERLNVEMMQLFKRHKVNPMSGCIPMILQFPVYIALYRVLWNSIELYQTPFLYYNDLSQPDPYYITPVLLAVVMILQQKFTPSATVDPAQKKMMMIMPVMFAVFLAFLPVGLVIYILVNTLFTVIQQWMNNNDIHVRDLIRGRLKRQRA